jgi:formylmethanofuran dehydrogenase subunit D
MSSGEMSSGQMSLRTNFMRAIAFRSNVTPDKFHAGNRLSVKCHFGQISLRAKTSEKISSGQMSLRTNFMRAIAFRSNVTPDKFYAGNRLSVKCHFGQISLRAKTSEKISSGQMLSGQTSLRTNFVLAIIFRSNVTPGKFRSGQKPLRKCLPGKCRRGKRHSGQISCGQSPFGQMSLRTNFAPGKNLRENIFRANVTPDKLEKLFFGQMSLRANFAPVKNLRENVFRAHVVGANVTPDKFHAGNCTNCLSVKCHFGQISLEENVFRANVIRANATPD